MASRDSTARPRKMSTTRMTFNVLILKYRYILSLLYPDNLLHTQSSRSKLFVSSLKACKLYNSSQGCLKPSCLIDINGKTNIGDSDKGSKKTLVCKSPTATSLQMTKSTTSFIVSNSKSTGERQILTEAQKTLTLTMSSTSRVWQ